MNDSPVDCQNREWTEPQRDIAPAAFPHSITLTNSSSFLRFFSLGVSAA